MTHAPILSAQQASRRYGARAAVDQASFTLQQGRITCLLGPSGCGKSSLLRMISGLEPVDEGSIHIGGELVSAPRHHVAPEHRGVGLVFQDNALFPHLDVSDNIGFGLRHLSKQARAERVAHLLHRFHISHLAQSWPHMLSGGEQQRVAIARAMAREPHLLLLDEPFSGLDRNLRETLRAALLSDLRDAGATVLIVTHDPEEAMAMADDLMLMDGGRLLQMGTPIYCYDQPASLPAARLLGDMAVFDVTIKGGQAYTPWSAWAVDAAFPDGAAQMMLRPSALCLSDQGVAAKIIDSRYLGREWAVTVDIAGQSITLKTCAQWQGGDAPHITADLSRAIFLPA
jgi:iron(III) transport system ATP-binding protein